MHENAIDGHWRQHCHCRRRNNWSESLKLLRMMYSCSCLFRVSFFLRSYLFSKILVVMRFRAHAHHFRIIVPNSTLHFVTIFSRGVVYADTLPCIRMKFVFLSLFLRRHKRILLSLCRPLFLSMENQVIFHILSLVKHTTWYLYCAHIEV